MSGYRSIAQALRHEGEPIQRSRFVADAMPVADAADAAAADAAVTTVRSEFSDASHHCWAYRLPPRGLVFRSSDDGEPRGSAGAPILKRIEGADYVGVLVVVTRWFGGTKLGVGGLMRAYGGAAAAVLENAQPYEVVPMRRFSARYPYAADGRVKALLAAAQVAPLDQDYGADIVARFCLPVPQAESLMAQLIDATAGAAEITSEAESEDYSQ